MECPPGFRFLEKDEIIQEGDCFYCADPVRTGDMPFLSWTRIANGYQNIKVSDCIEMLRKWWAEPMYFSTNRPQPEPKPEPIIIGKLLANLESS